MIRFVLASIALVAGLTRMETAFAAEPAGIDALAAKGSPLAKGETVVKAVARCGVEVDRARATRHTERAGLPKDMHESSEWVRGSVNRQQGVGGEKRTRRRYALLAI